MGKGIRNGNGGRTNDRRARGKTGAASGAATRRHPVRDVIAAALAVALAAGAGYAVGGFSIGSGESSSERCLNDARLDIVGQPQTASYTDDFTARGTKLTKAEAGPYYEQAVNQSWQKIDDAMLAATGGDLPAMRSAGASAADAIDGTIETLLSHTWPAEVDNAVEQIARDYADLRGYMRYMASAVDEDAGGNTMMLEFYSFSKADVYLRGKLGLDAPRPHTMPLEIRSVEDIGVYDASTDGDGDADKAALTGKRVVRVTVRSRVPAVATEISLKFALRSSTGRTVDSVWGTSERIALAKGQSAVVDVPLEPTLAKSGMGLQLRGLAASSGHDVDHNMDIADDYARTVVPLSDFRLK
ncbi:hypothetical protein GFD17_00765 [Bifidobacterium sp. SMB2]|uniref:Secreted protein n=1 Tax=Bifidobacterium saimiriisciurei TaxID=2661627 RepID=A0ABX0CFH2_9BIFI|nr:MULTISPECIES: hypothetical protein [Bifidobacterium]NEG95313.1 hypothetical protein [Bifidobacterium sp. SMB2]NEH12520.1 hypothetical protein [Bifidobacterium saimiriisciurei]